MSTGQLGLLKQLTNSQGFSTEISADSEAAQFRNPEESNIGTSSCQSSLEEEEVVKGYDDDGGGGGGGDDYSDEVKDDDDDGGGGGGDGDDDDDDDDESSYESETLDKTENTDDNLSESLGSSQVSLERITKDETVSTSLGLEKDEEMDEIQEQNPESTNKTRKSVSFDGICKSKEMTHTEGSSNTIDPQVTMPDSLAIHKDVSLGRKKMMRQENIHLGGDEEKIASVSVSKASSTTSISANGSMPTSNEPSSGHGQRNPSMKIPCQESTPILDNSSPKLSAIRQRRQRQTGWSTPPVSIDERLNHNYKELYQLMTRDVEVKGKERQLVHAFQMEQLYEKYISVSYGKIPPITLYPHYWPQCVIRRLFSPTLSTLHSARTNYSNATSFGKPTYVFPRSALSLENDSSMKKAKKVKESKDTKCQSKLNNQMSVQESHKSRESSNDQPLGNSFSARSVDHRLGHSTNPDILKWLNGKNQIFLEQKKEEQVQKKLEKETKKLETLMKAERRLQSQQAVYNWMQQKLKESQQSLLEEKHFGGGGGGGGKTEMKKETEAHLCDGAFAEDKKEQHDNYFCDDAFAEDKKEQHDNYQEVCSKKFSESQSKLKGHLRPLQGKIKTNKKSKFFSVKGSHFKHMESALNYDAWTRQTVNDGCTKVSDYCDDSGGSIKSKKKIVKDQESHYCTANSEYLGKEKENISLQENGIKLKANENKLFMQKQTTRPKTARGPRRVRHSSNSNFLDVSEHFDKVKSHSGEKKQDGKLSGNESRFNVSASHEDFDLDRNSSQNGGIKRLEIMDDDKKGDNGTSDSTEKSW